MLNLRHSYCHVCQQVEYLHKVRSRSDRTYAVCNRCDPFQDPEVIKERLEALESDKEIFEGVLRDMLHILVVSVFVALGMQLTFLAFATLLSWLYDVPVR